MPIGDENDQNNTETDVFAELGGQNVSHSSQNSDVVNAAIASDLGLNESIQNVKEAQNQTVKFNSASIICN